MRNVKGRKEVKKIHKTVKAKQNHFYFKEKRVYAGDFWATENTTGFRIQLTINKVVRKRKLLRNEKKNMKIMIIRRKSRKKKSENKMQFPRGGVPRPPAPNHTRGEVFRPPSQIENNPYCALVARLRLPLDHLETVSYNRINCRCTEF